MADKNASDAESGEAGDAESTGKSRKLKLIIGAVVLVAAGAFVGSKVLGGGAATAGAVGPTTTTTEPPGMVTTIDAITLNLADGRFLKLGLAFEVRDGVDYPVNFDEKDEVTKGFAREIDAAIELFSSYTYEQLAAPNAKNEAKAAFLAELDTISDDAVKDVFFHEFVMQ